MADKYTAQRRRYGKSIKGRYNRLISKAKSRKLDVTISLAEYREIIKYGQCDYCKGPLPELGYGLDRLDNRIGYVHGNIAACCARCNELKGRIEYCGFTFPRTVDLLKELVHPDGS